MSLKIKIAALIALGSTFLLAACGGDSKLPNPTGKGTVRAINAISTSPPLDFMIEESNIGSVAYKNVSEVRRWDDFSYNFSFDVLYAGDLERTRIATQELQVVAEQDYTFLISGSIDMPTLTLWESSERVFAADTTVLQIRFAHTANSIGPVDYYFADAAIVPALGEEAATLSFGEIAEPIDFEAGSYVLTITTAGNPADVLYTSSESAYTAASNLIISPFDGDENDLAPLVVRAFNSAGNVSTLGDPAFPPVVEFLNASLDLGTVDIYDDTDLTSLLVEDHTFKQLTVEYPLTAGVNTLQYTPANDTGTTLVSSGFLALSGTRYRVIAVGIDTAFSTSVFTPDRKSEETTAKIQFQNTNTNFAFIDIYVVDRDASIEDFNPLRSGIGFGASISISNIAAGDYDLYITEFAQKDPLAGPLPLDLVLGDVKDLVLFDTVDPAVLELADLGAP